ncbi:MAG: response regulator transcription factor [Acidobacteriota bacterium]
MRVLLADDHALVRAGLRALVAALPFVTDVYEAADGREAIAVATAEHPEVVLMDIAMPVMNGFEAMSRVLKDLPGTRVVMLSMYEDEEFVWRALRLGASGYVAKSAAVAELEAALRAVDAGEVYISPTLRTAANDAQARKVGEGDPQLRLTPRQREILQMIAEGMTSREIGETLHIHIKTVESHRMHLMKRLGIHDVAGLVRYAIRHKVVLTE